MVRKRFGSAQSEQGKIMTTPTPADPAVTPGDNTPDPVDPPKVEIPRADTPPAGNPNLDSLVTAIGALPEKIVDSLREAMQPSSPAPAQTPATQTANPAAQAVQTSHAEPGKKSFTDWWFGK